MTAALAWLTLALALAPPAPSVEPGHAPNAVYRELLDGKLRFAGAADPIAAPTLVDGSTADQQAAALLKVAGSAEKLKELVKDSVTAPFILRPPQDRKTPGGDTIRGVDLWFIIHADLDAIDPARLGEQPGPVEAGNMRFEGRTLPADALKARKVEAAPKDEWYAHLSGLLLDRIQVEVTDRVVASRTAGSLVVASRTADAFDHDRGEKDLPNHWLNVFPGGKGQVPGSYAHRYPGGGGYAKISRLEGVPGALLVELHAAFVEPKEWFQGAPILRSKIALVAQDRIRKLRRDLGKARGKADATDPDADPRLGPQPEPGGAAPREGVQGTRRP